MALKTEDLRSGAKIGLLRSPLLPPEYMTLKQRHEESVGATWSIEESGEEYLEHYLLLDGFIPRDNKASVSNSSSKMKTDKLYVGAKLAVAGRAAVVKLAEEIESGKSWLDVDGAQWSTDWLLINAVPYREAIAMPVEPLISAKDLTDTRKSTHGDWTAQAQLANRLKNAMHNSINWDQTLTTGQREALDMIAVKISRILTGDAQHVDHWDDIAGYAFLGKGGHKS